MFKHFFLTSPNFYLASKVMSFQKAFVSALVFDSPSPSSSTEFSFKHLKANITPTYFISPISYSIFPY